MSITVKTLNEGFNRRYNKNQNSIKLKNTTRLKEWQSSKESGFTDGNRIFVKVDLSGVDNSQFISNMIGRNLSSLRLPPVLLEDNSDGTYALVFPGIADFKKLIEDNLDLTGLPYEISEDQYFSN